MAFGGSLPQINLGVQATRGLLATDHVILNHGQVTWTTPELAPPLLTTTPHQREDISALDRFNVHRCPTRRVFSGTGIEPVTKQATVRYLYHSATAAPSLWEALPEQDLTFDDFVLVDTDIAVWEALSDAEIVALDHNNTESDEDE
ncbi:uncharacterized protein TNCV_5093871 [Trichonephila clavipes]|nr:uncharacterized protein TNCV_5093871 [Trichonephila clavipes]